MTRYVLKYIDKNKQEYFPFGSKAASGPDIFIKSSPIETTVVYDAYWNFATERQEIFFSRVDGNLSTKSKDHIFMKYKFTNAYRASDRVSQYLIKNVIYKGDQSEVEVFFRTILFKLFNKIETWELLTKSLGEISYAEFSFDKYDRILTESMERGERIYSAAYIMPSRGLPTVHKKKHRMHLELVKKMIVDELPKKIADSENLENVYRLLLSYPGIGKFLAFQYAIDLNYSNIVDFSEMDFVVAGPGAQNGILKCFSGIQELSEEDVIKYMAEVQEKEFHRLGLNFKSLWGRPLQLIDCQNLFCEIDKYSRVKYPEFSERTGRTRIKQQYRKKSNDIDYFYPPKWGINSLIENFVG